MTITATFSTGQTDTYKGRRPVKAAWAIFSRETGELLMSGHSLDRVKADKTARGNLSDLGRAVGVETHKLDIPQRLYAGASYAWLYERARANGYTGRAVMGAYKTFAREHNARRMAEIEARVRIEIVDL